MKSKGIFMALPVDANLFCLIDISAHYIITVRRHQSKFYVNIEDKIKVSMEELWHKYSMSWGAPLKKQKRDSEYEMFYTLQELTDHLHSTIKPPKFIDFMIIFREGFDKPRPIGPKDIFFKHF